MSAATTATTATADFQYRMLQEIEESEYREQLTSTTIGNLVLPTYMYEAAERTCDAKNMSAEGKSDRLSAMMLDQQVQTMICKPTQYTKAQFNHLKEELGKPIAANYLFDGGRRLSLLREFIAGKCYIKMFNDEDGCDYYLWNTQEAVDAVESAKEYNLLIEYEWRNRLMGCHVSMIVLDKKLSDTAAYERARMANCHGRKLADEHKKKRKFERELTNDGSGPL